MDLTIVVFIAVKHFPFVSIVADQTALELVRNDDLKRIIAAYLHKVRVQRFPPAVTFYCTPQLKCQQCINLKLHYLNARRYCICWTAACFPGGFYTRVTTVWTLCTSLFISCCCCRFYELQDLGYQWIKKIVFIFNQKQNNSVISLMYHLTHRMWTVVYRRLKVHFGRYPDVEVYCCGVPIIQTIFVQISHTWR